MRRFALVLLRIVAFFYLYGASVHVLNMLSLTGFDWLASPLKWQVLDVVYLILDLLVAVGLFAGWKIGFIAFYIAAVSQSLLYTVLKDWVITVPADFLVSAEQQSYLATLVIFHLVTLVVVTLALRARRRINS